MDSIGPDEFLDKADDRRILNEFLGKAGVSKSRVMVLHAPAASGVTYFLKDTRRRLSNLSVAIYSDLQSDNLGIILRRYAAEHARIFRHRICSFFRFRNLLPLLIRISGFILPSSFGRPAAVGAENIANVLLDTPYHSAPLQRFAEDVICPWDKRPVVFLIDNAQANFHKLEDLLRATYAPEYDRIKFVLAFVDRQQETSEFSEFRQRILSTGHHISPMDFKAPDDQLVAAFSHAYQIDLPPEERDELIIGAGANIWRIRSFFILDERAENISNEEIYVLRLLYVAEQPLQLSDLRIIGSDSPLTVTAGERHWNDLISSLARRNYISIAEFDGGDRLISISITTHPCLDISSTDRLIYAKELYEFFLAVAEQVSLRHAPSAVHSLLYRLSKLVANEDSPRWAKELIKAALSQGSLSDAERYIKSARLGNITTREDLLVQVAFYVSVQAYSHVMELLEATRTVWTGHRIFEIIYAVALNRTRAHDEFFREIALLLSDTKNPDEIALLTSYKVSGLIHAGRLSDATNCVVTAPAKISAAHGYGYYLRNAAAAFMWGPGKDLTRARKMLDEAEKWFVRSNDAFGALSARCNLGCIDFYEGEKERAHETFEELYKSTRIFGTQHIKEIGTNLGIARLMVGDADAAYRHLITICDIIVWEFARCLAESTLAFIEARNGEFHAAKQRMEVTLRHAQGIRIEEIKMRCSTNNILIKIMSGENPSLYHEKISLLRKRYGDRDRYATLEELCKAPNDTEMQLRVFDYDLCQYWSQNPLVMLSHTQLS
uniref:Tetratricopeptide repeat-containing protein n=1 Tax=Candidatus Kentrum sp. TUN TaxID=2126343 RepID=A0A450ZT51_9GAMM|nr:MAG: hypothetical protein BECKTUN1418D_GA0071000_105613 [Candidatus Kentron sp. TUN]